ncbi:arylesterase [Rheinheimera sp. WS51]|uniref:arylesterase n=1 Tax=Rheinheimera sp. WS51 TaxID=3425886 RepID=UPI003D8CB6BD
MRIIFFIFLSIFSQTALAEKLLILGDSLSAAYNMEYEQGWPHLLQQDLNWQLINASISGETTAGAAARLPALLQQHQPDYVLIELGGNDGLRGFPLPAMKNNLNQIITLIKQHKAQPILMQIRIPPNYGPRYGREFTNIYPELAKQHNIVLWPFFMEKIAINSDLMLADGIHPNTEAQPQIKEIIKALINELGEE